MTRESLLAQTFVELADTLVDEFDVVDLLTMLANRCTELLDVSASGVMLATPQGELRLLASSSEAMRTVELFELQTDEGPCIDAYRTRVPVLNQRLSAPAARWSKFEDIAIGAGFRSVHALPLRLRNKAIGAINLFSESDAELGVADQAAGQALADAATITIMQHETQLEAQTVIAQLTTALDSRIAIEQAKGVLAERAGISVEVAFEQLRQHARRNNLRLADVARSLIDGTLDASALEPS